MSEFRVKNILGIHMSSMEMKEASELLSQSYTSWQNNPKNTNPLKTDTSPDVYVRMMRGGLREVVLCYEDDLLKGVFVHSLSPQYDQYPLRKLSYLGARPGERGYKPLLRIFQSYSEFMREQGEDAIITSDLDQATLNSLLTDSGFRDIEDRNETYYLLSQLLKRKLMSSQKVRNDFVVDEIITCNGKAIRRDKRLLKLQTTPLNFYDIYCAQQRSRVERCLHAANIEGLQQSLAHSGDGIFFISDYVDAITERDRKKGGFDSQSAVFGLGTEKDIHEFEDDEDKVIHLVPSSDDDWRKIADQTVFRQGFFDFLSYCFKILGSFFVVTGVSHQEVNMSLDRDLHPDIRLKFGEMIEKVFTPEVTPVRDVKKEFSDGVERTAYSFEGPYAGFGPDGYHVRKDAMIETILSYRNKESKAPVVYLGNRVSEPGGIRRLFQESRDNDLPVLVFDFGTELTTLIEKEMIKGEPEKYPWFSVVNVRDFYQIPVMLESMGLKADVGIEMAVF